METGVIERLIKIEVTRYSSFCWLLQIWNHLGRWYIGRLLLKHHRAPPWLQLDPFPLKAHAGRNQVPRGLQHAAQGLKGNSMKYRYGGDRCLQWVVRWHWDTTQWLPPLERNLMSGIVKRWSDIGGALAVFAGRSLGSLFNSTPSDNLLLSTPVSESLWSDH